MVITQQIDDRLAEIKIEMEELETKLAALEEEQEALERAKWTIEEYIGGGEPENKKVGKKNGLTDQQNAVLRAVPFGMINSLAPSEIAEKCRSLSADYVRTTLRRLLQDNWVDSADGRYWIDL